MQSTCRILPCLFFLSCCTSASAQVPQPLFDQGVDASGILRSLKAGEAGSEPPAFRASDQNVYRYRLDHYPKQAGACLPAAQRIGADLERITGVRVAGSVCEGEDETGYKIVVSYAAEQPLDLVSTVGRSYRADGFGAYADAAACQAALAGETQAFRTATGLEPVAAYCFQDPLARSDPWTVRIDAFGQARLEPDTQSVFVFTYPRGATREQFLGGIQAKLLEQGVNVRSVFWRSEGGYASLSVSYYAQDRISLELAEPAKLDTQAQCESALVEIRGFLTGRSPEPLVDYCGTTSIGGWEIAWLFKDEPSLKTVKASETYDSREECRGALDGTVRHYRESMGHSVAGAVCSHEVLDYGWKVVLFED